MLFFGIDLGTQGVRGIVVNETGEPVSFAGSKYSEINISGNRDFFEQSAESWIESVEAVIRECISILKIKGFSVEDIAGIGVDGTSGTIIPLDSGSKPLTNAVMYNDGRSTEEAYAVQRAGEKLSRKLGYSFKPTFALPKILWIKDHLPEVFEKTGCFLHQADYILGYLTENYRCSDYSNSLKTGYDPINMEWPAFIHEELGIPTEKLPEVHPPGTVVGEVSASISERTGLSPRTKVCVAATDGIAASIASGIKQPGDYNTTIGTTLITKTLTGSIIRDDRGVVYCHRHPEGFWIPGGASNTGGNCLNQRFKDRNLDDLNDKVDLKNPSGLLCYPLTGRGERFPFTAEDAEGFIEGLIKNDQQVYTAMLEGVAFIERLTYEVMERIGCDKAKKVYSVGGGAKSESWLQIRANILNLPVSIPKVADTAMGAAVFAASKIEYLNVSDAVEGMVRMKKDFLPDPEMAGRYDDLYRRFKTACMERGYIEE